MRGLALLLLLSAAAVAQEPAAGAIRADLDGERFAVALERAEAALLRRPHDKLLLYLRAQAVRGVARDLQRTRGYRAAMNYLEPRLDHPLLANAYADVALWGGEEERGIEGLRGSPVAVKDRIEAELKLLHFLYRYDEAARRAEELGWPEAARWARGEAELRERLRGRARRGARVALAAGLALLAAAALLFKLAPSRPAPAPGRAIS